ncbi:MAG: glycosyltransferase, partial [Gemmatimonadetes bacterium]|nr:glycosyltransferase [Gemmatimonadota bacterium]
MSLRRAQAVIAVSRGLEEQLLGSGVPRSRLWYIPNAYEAVKTRPREQARAALGVTSTATVVGWIGRFSAEKGADVFLRAMKCLVPLGVQAVMIGDGPEKVPTMELARDLGLGSTVCFVGPVPDASTLMKAFDLVVISSHTEGLPLVLLEAMGAGVPVVATAVGEIPKVLDRGRLGMLAPPGEPERLADAMRGVLRDLSGAAERAARAQQQVADHYGVDSWVDQIIEVYQAAL